MTVKFELHDATCPRLTLGTVECRPEECTGSQMVAVDKKEWEELVEAASKMFDPADGYPVQRSGRHWFRLDAALQPFRRGEKP